MQSSSCLVVMYDAAVTNNQIILVLTVSRTYLYHIIHEIEDGASLLGYSYHHGVLSSVHPRTHMTKKVDYSL